MPQNSNTPEEERVAAWMESQGFVWRYGAWHNNEHNIYKVSPFAATFFYRATQSARQALLEELEAEGPDDGDIVYDTENPLANKRGYVESNRKWCALLRQKKEKVKQC